MKKEKQCECGMPDPRQAEFLAGIMAQKINEFGRELFFNNKDIKEDDRPNLQGMVWQKLSIWMFASTIKLGQIVGMNSDELSKMMMDTLQRGMKMSETIKPQFEDSYAKEKTN